MKKAIVCGGFLFLTLSAWGQRLQLGTPTLSGSGCPAGTATATVSTDQSVITVLYSAFHAEAAQEETAVANCNMNIPVQVPAGYMLRVFRIDYRGFINLPGRNALGELSTNHEFLNRRVRRGEHRNSKTFRGPQATDFTDRQAIRNAWDSDCGAQTDIRMNTQIVVRNRMNPNRTEIAEMSLDSLDSDGAGLQYQVGLRPCRGNNRRD